jgi:hypothetical protein
MGNHSRLVTVTLDHSIWALKYPWGILQWVITVRELVQVLCVKLQVMITVSNDARLMGV